MFYINKYYYGVGSLLPKESREWKQGMTLIEYEGKRYCCSRKELSEICKTLDDYGCTYYQLVPVDVKQRLTYLSRHDIYNSGTRKSGAGNAGVMENKDGFVGNICSPEDLIKIQRTDHIQYIHPTPDAYSKNKNIIKDLMDKHRVGTFSDIIWPRCEDGFVYHEITGLSKLEDITTHLLDKKYKIRRSKGEQLIARKLDELGIVYIEQFCFDDCKSKRKLRFDFYIPSRNICIEYDGEQHHKPVEIFGGETGFENTKMRDAIKTNYCLEKKIKLIRYTNEDIADPSFSLVSLLENS